MGEQESEDPRDERSLLARRLRPCPWKASIFPRRRTTTHLVQNGLCTRKVTSQFKETAKTQQFFMKKVFLKNNPVSQQTSDTGFTSVLAAINVFWSLYNQFNNAMIGIFLISLKKIQSFNSLNCFR